VMTISKFTRLSQDAALGIVLSVFFGVGVAMLGIIQKMRGAQAAGLDSFIYGKTASMIRTDALLIGIAALIVIALTIILFKEFRLYTFDPDFAAGDGWPVQRLDLLLMSLVVAITVLGLQAVGIILIIALLIVPPAAARFWTESLSVMVVLSALFGALGGYLGTGISAIAPRLPPGAVIVAVLGGIFLVGLLVGRSRGVLLVVIRERMLRRATLRQKPIRVPPVRWDTSVQFAAGPDASLSAGFGYSHGNALSIASRKVPGCSARKAVPRRCALPVTTGSGRYTSWSMPM